LKQKGSSKFGFFSLSQFLHYNFAFENAKKHKKIEKHCTEKKITSKYFALIRAFSAIFENGYLI